MRKSKKVSPKGPVVTVEKSGAGSKVGVEVGKADTRSETPTHRIQPGGGYLLTGNPGNKGGGSTPDELRGTIRRIIEVHGLPYLEAALSATGTVTCPHCKGKVEVPADPKLMAKLLDTGLRTVLGTPTQVEHKGHVTLHPSANLTDNEG